MRVILDASAAVHQRAGLGRYTQELIRGLISADPEGDYWAFFNRSRDAQVDAPFDLLPQVSSPQGDKPWRMKVLLAHMLRRPQDHLFPGVDIFHATDNLLPYFQGVRSVFTLPDLTHQLFPQTQSSLNRQFLKIMLPYFLLRAQAVISISESTRKDALRLYPLVPEKIRVIYPGVSAQFRPSQDQVPAVRERYRLPEHYALFVGTIEPRKNLVRLLEALRIWLDRGCQLPLVIVGNQGWGSKAFYQRLEALRLKDAVHFSGFVPEIDLPGMYSGASVVVYPSLYEGFGLPVLEAMACGTVVVCSNSSSLPEAAGEAAILVSPYDVNGMAEAVIRVVRDEELRTDWIKKGVQQAARFSWQTCAQQTLEVYRQVLQA